MVNASDARGDDSPDAGNNEYVSNGLMMDDVFPLQETSFLQSRHVEEKGTSIMPQLSRQRILLWIIPAAMIVTTGSYCMSTCILRRGGADFMVTIQI